MPVKFFLQLCRVGCVYTKKERTEKIQTRLDGGKRKIKSVRRRRLHGEGFKSQRLFFLQHSFSQIENQNSPSFSFFFLWSHSGSDGNFFLFFSPPLCKLTNFFFSPLLSLMVKWGGGGGRNRVHRPIMKQKTFFFSKVDLKKKTFFKFCNFWFGKGFFPSLHVLFCFLTSIHRSAAFTYIIFCCFSS